MFRVYYENNTNAVDYGTGNIVCMLFSGNYDAGHLVALQNNSH